MNINKHLITESSGKYYTGLKGPFTSDGDYIVDGEGVMIIEVRKRNIIKHLLNILNESVK